MLSILARTLILTLIFLSPSGIVGQTGPSPELAASSGVTFNAPLELISQQASAGNTRQFGSTADSDLERLARYFHIDMSPQDPIIHLLVQIRDGAAAELIGNGFPILSRIGDVVATSTPLSHLNRLREVAGVVKAEAARAMQPEIDTSMVVTGVDLLRTRLGNGVFTGQTGAGALVAIVDSGIDIFHEDFRKRNGTTRIKAIWDVADQSFQNSGGVLGTLPPLKRADGVPVGTVYTEAQINAALTGSGFVNSRSLEGHGHHVAGVAAGNGRATGGGQAAGRFIGAAPEADLIIVQIFSNDETSASVAFEDRLLAALGYIDQMALDSGRPVAVNMSFGTHIGAHDGSSLMERAIDTFSGPGKRGRVVVKSAGNDGTRNIHAGGQFGPPGAINSTITVQVTRTGSSPVMFDFWFSGADTFKVSIDGGGSGAGILTGLLNADPANGDKELFFETSRTGSFSIFIEGVTVTNGRFDAWIPSRNAVFNTFAEGLSRLTLPGTAQNIITVASFNTKNSWVDLDGVLHTLSFIEVGNLSTFSSDGPTRDGRIKPEIAAPGQRIASSLAGNLFTELTRGENIFFRQDVTEDRKHALSQGTSFSAPHVTGTCALMLSKNPNLDAPAIRDLITGHATVDSFTGSGVELANQVEILPDNRWGFGKLNAKATLDATPIPVPTRFLAFIDSPSMNASVPQSFSVAGWMLASHGVASAEVLVDGRAATSATLGAARPDVCAIFPEFDPDCPKVGFQALVEGLDFGSHTIGLRITDKLGNQTETAVVPRMVRVNPMPIRSIIDAPSSGVKLSPNFEMFGWAISDAGIRSVEVLLDGTFLMNALMKQTRSDVCTVFPGGDPDCPQVGFRALLSDISSGSHELTARITDNNGARRSVSVTIEVAMPRIGAMLDAPVMGEQVGGSLTLNGWATSPFRIESVKMILDGTVQGFAALKVPRPDVCAAFPGSDPDCPNVGFSGSLNNVALGSHTLSLMIRDTQGEIAVRTVDITVALTGVLDGPTPGAALSSPFQILGWGLSPSGITTIEILLDGAVAATTTPDVMRADVCTAFPGADPGCPTVGFQGMLATLPGTHTLAIRLTNGDGIRMTLPIPPIGVSVGAAKRKESEIPVGLFH